MVLVSGAGADGGGQGANSEGGHRGSRSSGGSHQAGGGSCHTSSGGGRSRTGGPVTSDMDKLWGVTVAPPKQRHDPCPWHKHEVSEKERAKHLQSKLKNKKNNSVFNIM